MSIYRKPYSELKSQKLHEVKKILEVHFRYITWYHYTCKTATFESELQVSMGPRLRLLICEWKTAWLDPEWRLPIDPSHHLWFCAFKTATFASRLLVSMGPRPHLSFCACITMWLASEIPVSMGPSPHLWFFAYKTATFGSELQVSMGPDLTYGFLHKKQLD